MIAPSSFEEAIAMCAAQGLGPSACADLMAPFCDGNIWIEAGKPPRCLALGAGERKAAILAREKAARDAAAAAGDSAVPSAWWLVGGAVLLVGVVAVVARQRS